MKKFNIKSFKLGFVLSILFITSCSVIDALDRADAAYWNEQYGYERYEVKQTEQQLANKSKTLEESKSICRTYGFKDNTDGMGNCLIELRKLDATNNQIAQQQAELKKQQQAQALINLGTMIGGDCVQNN